MYLSRIELDPGSGEQWVGSEYTAHQLVWSWFTRGPSDTRSFLYRVDGRGGEVRIMALAPHPPAVSAGWRADVRPFAPVLRVDDRLAFSARVNPTIRREGHRHDVVMDLRRRLHDTPPEERPSPAELVQRAVSQWLEQRAERCGFTLAPESLRADAYTRVHFGRKGGAVDFHQVEIGGLLTVRDPERMLALLHGGLGSSRGFGCGLFLVRRA